MGDNSSYTLVIDTLCEQLEKEPISEQRIRIIQTLQEIGNEKSLLSLAKATGDDNYYVRKAAIESSQIIKVKFISYLKDFVGSQENILNIIQEEAILDRVGKTVFAFKKGTIKMENNSKIHQNFHGSVGSAVGNVQGDLNFTGNIISNSDTNLRDTATEVKQLLEKLATTYPTTTSKEKNIVVGEVVEQIENNAPLKAQVINALKTRGIEAFKKEIDHPLVNILLASIEGWKDVK